ncbi:MAG TPA: DUF1924 domain-containing protein, partial [Vulgatibacter sp.]
ALASSLLVLVPAHVLGVIVSSFLERQNLIKGMLTGRKKAAEADLAPTPAKLPRFVVASLAGIGVVLGLASLLKPGEARADAPTAAAMMRSLEGEALAADPAFAGFSAEEGRALFAAEHVAKGKAVSCATCHGADPGRPGRTPSGKKLAPLSPVSNPRAFANASKAKKKFDRYCHEVMGRTCTAIEKGNVLAWLLEG